MSDICEVPRWQLLKSKLVNLDYPSFVQQYKANNASVLLDVRTEDELFDALREDVLHIDYLSSDLADLLEDLDRSKHYFVYCRTGRRSVRVCTLLRNAGFEHIYNLDGGMIGVTEQMRKRYSI